MTTAPFLTSADVRQEVERLFGKRHRSHLVALFGRGESDHFEVDGQAWQIVPTRCELDLREHLPRPDEAVAAGRVFLVDWIDDVLPLDVACRLAGGRIYHVAKDARLASLFGARQVEAGLSGTALARLLLAGAVAQPRKIQGLMLTRADAWQRLLEGCVGVKEPTLASLPGLVAWAAGSEGGPAFVKLADTDEPWRATRRELHTWIAATFGEPGAVVWRAWEQGRAGRLAEVLPLMEATPAAGSDFLAGQLAGQLTGWFGDLAPSVRAAADALTTGPVLDALFEPTDGARLALAERSQGVADAAGLGALAAASHRLPAGHTEFERGLAQRVLSFLVHPDAEHAAAVVAAEHSLGEHRLDATLRSLAERDARTMLVRLTLWLAGRTDEPTIGPRWQPAVDLARRYTEEGGFVEWSRKALRGLRHGDETLLSACRALGDAVTDAQRADHRAFAHAYVSWLEAGKPSGEAVPIEEVTRQIVAPFVTGGARRRLLVVLMDGMSHAAAAQVLTRLGDARRWRPIAWRRPNWNGQLPLPPVLAVAPTLTEVSRAAFFAGIADPRFGNEGTEKDIARWNANKHVAALQVQAVAPLFLRKDILSGHDLAKEIRDAVDGDAKVVAIVVNAIDEDLKSSVQVDKDYSASAVLPLEALLSAAEGAERVVLLIADHGHVLGDGTRSLEGRLTAGRPGGPRWRALGMGEAPADDEVVLPRGGWVPAGWDRVAVLWDPSVVNRAAHYGEHGGLSLAEAVSPAILIAPEWLERAIPEDPELASRPLPLPDWWNLRLRRPAPKPVPVPPKPAAQASLFGQASAAAPVPATATLPTLAIVEALRRSAVFQAQVEQHPASEVARVLDWLASLASAGGTLPAADFALAAGVRTHQVGGVVARMGILNADGFAMVEHDHVGRRVVLQRSRLEQHYGIKS